MILFSKLISYNYKRVRAFIRFCICSGFVSVNGGLCIAWHGFVTGRRQSLQFILGLWMPLFGRGAIPFYSFFIIPGNAGTFFVYNAQMILCIGKALFSRLQILTYKDLFGVVL